MYMGPTKIFRPTSSRYLAITVWAILATSQIAALVSSQVTGSVRLLAPFGLIAVVVWLFLWRPLVEVSDGTITIVNPLKTVTIPWPAYSEAHIHGTLIVTTTAAKTVSAYAAPIRNRRSDHGVAGDLLAELTARHDALTEAGFLDNIRTDGAQVTQTTATLGAVALAVLALASIANWVI